MPDPGVQRDGGGVRSRDERSNDLQAARAKGPLSSLGLGSVEQAILGAFIPGIGIADTAFDAAKFLGGTVRDTLVALGLESTAPAIQSGLESLLDKDKGTDQKAVGKSIASKQNKDSLAIASNLFSGNASLIPPGPVLSDANKGAGEQILQQLGAEQVAAMISGGGEADKPTAAAEPKKASPTQSVSKPAGTAKQSRDENRSEIEQFFFDLINSQLAIKP